MSSNRQKIQQVIYDCIEKAIEILLLRYGKNCAPKGKHGRHAHDILENIHVATRLLHRNLHSSLVIDIFREGGSSNQSPLLLERWNIHFQQRKEDSKDVRLSYISKHTGILIRTLYCYVRLLSSYNLSERCQDCKITFQIYSHDDATIEKAKFASDSSSYAFPKIRTPYGGLSLSLKFLPSATIKDLINPIVDSIPTDTKNDMVIDAVMQPPTEDHFVVNRRHSLGTASPAPIPIPPSSWEAASTPHIGTAPAHTVMESLTPPTNDRQVSRSLDSKGSAITDGSKAGTSSRATSATGPYGHISRPGKPPTHPDVASYSSNNSPFSTASVTPAFYIASSPLDNDTFGDDLGFGTSPPYQAPPTHLLSTSPQIGSNMLNMREQYAGMRVPSQKFQGSRPNSSQHNSAGSSSLGIDLGEIPISPFDEDMSVVTDSGKDPTASAGQRPSWKTADDTDDIFDDISDDEDMPFAWSQAPADEFVFKKSTSIKSGEAATNGSAYHSFIAQQCVAPPVLSSFQNDRFSQSQTTNDAFLQLQQFKDFNVAISQRLT